MDQLVTAFVPFIFMFYAFWFLARLIVPKSILYTALGHLLRDFVLFAFRCAIALIVLPFTLLNLLLSTSQGSLQPKHRHRQRRHGTRRRFN